jgi:hypothetical protein
VVRQGDLLIHGHVDTVECLLTWVDARDMTSCLVQSLRVGLNAANLDTIHALLHHACRKRHALERVMSESSHMRCAGGSCRCIHLWVLTLLHGTLTHLVSSSSSLSILNTASEHGH